jgi:putative component of toxin-antitoxin plasmid stabilization module
VSVRKGMHVRELTKKVGQVARTGVVQAVRDGIVEVRWDDGHVSTLSGAVLVPVHHKSSN